MRGATFDRFMDRIGRNEVDFNLAWANDLSPEARKRFSQFVAKYVDDNMSDLIDRADIDLNEDQLEELMQKLAGLALISIEIGYQWRQSES